MKTILYVLVAIFILGIFKPAMTCTASQPRHLIFRAMEANVSALQLEQAAKVISGRLNDCYTEKFAVVVSTEKREIAISFSAIQDPVELELLLTQTGEMAFYETLDRKVLADRWSEAQQLFALFPDSRTASEKEIIGCTEAGKVAGIQRFLEASAKPDGCRLVWNMAANGKEAKLYALKTDENGRPLVAGSAIAKAQSSQDKKSGTAEINITLKKEAELLWADATRRNINHAIAIVLDDQVLAAPVVRSVIEGGRCVISGDYSAEQAKWIAALANNGSLPLHFKVVK